MPKLGIHGLVLADTVEKLKLNPNTTNTALEIEDNIDWAMLGAVGPDLFFWAPDYDVVQITYDMWQYIESWIDIYDKCMAPIRWVKDQVGEIVEPVYDALEDYLPTNTIDLINTVLVELKETASLFSSAILNKIVDWTSPLYTQTFFSGFTPPLQKNDPEAKWLWFDMLHYRKVGDFAKNLISNSKNGTARERAYAYGYLSHIATDLMGHPYVNQIVGGPFRLHVQRHVTVENWMDTRAYNERYSEDVSKTLVTRMGFPKYPQLPNDITNLLHKTFGDTYTNVAHPKLLGGDGFLSKSQIKATYEMFAEVLNIMHGMGVSRPEEPFSGVANIMAEAARELMQQIENFPDAPSAPSGMCSAADIFSFGFTESSRDCYSEFFEKTAEYIGYITKVIDWTVKTIVALIDAVLSMLGAIPVAVLLGILYMVQLGLYEIWKSARLTLALQGYVYPLPEEINTSHGRNLTTQFQCLIEPFIYPKHSKSEDKSHLLCPPDEFEMPGTVANFYPNVATVSAEEFISRTRFDFKSLLRYARATTPEETREIERSRAHIGNATDLTTWMITNASAENTLSADEESILYTNWNLDGDRGYGYKTWSAVLPKNGDGTVYKEKYV